jgi:hypothetical protein
MGKSGKAGPSGAWFILPAATLVAAAILSGYGAASFLHFAGSDFLRYQPNTSISVTRDGFTLYAPDGAIWAAALRCTAAGRDRVVQLRPVAGRTTLGNSHGTYMAIASTPHDLPEGRYVISCAGASGSSDLPLYVGPRVDLAAVGRLVAFNIIAPLLLGFCSVVLLVILVVLRYRSPRTTQGPSTPRTAG